jgi:hypothetical protein
MNRPGAALARRDLREDARARAVTAASQASAALQGNQPDVAYFAAREAARVSLLILAEQPYLRARANIELLRHWAAAPPSRCAGPTRASEAAVRSLLAVVGRLVTPPPTGA